MSAVLYAPSAPLLLAMLKPLYATILDFPVIVSPACLGNLSIGSHAFVFLFVPLINLEGLDCISDL
jgi:hypothetical protein